MSRHGHSDGTRTRPPPGRVAARCVAVVAALVGAGHGCSDRGKADFTAGGALFDGRSLNGWTVLSGSWSVANGAMVGVGLKSRIVREGTYPASYRLRFDVAPHGGPEVSWAVACPVGETFLLNKGLLHFAGEASDWRDAWQTVEVVVRDGRASYSYPALAERPRKARAEGRARFTNLERARELAEKGFGVFGRRDGLVVLAPHAETLAPSRPGFRTAEERGRQCLEGRHRGIALVVPCTGRDGGDLPPSAGARFRNVVVEALEADASMP